MSNELNLPREIVRTILTKDLGKRKLCATFVLHNPSDEQKQQRMDFIDAADKDDMFLQSILTGDESWDPLTKRQSMEYRGPSSPTSRSFVSRNQRLRQC
ncbi:hypothetical protein TNCV_2688001 [Trichonephila clavipes]|nr:hypothetical protein TNCV_2688001 [Trichonephila clavipes]